MSDYTKLVDEALDALPTIITERINPTCVVTTCPVIDAEVGSFVLALLDQRDVPVGCAAKVADILEHYGVLADRTPPKAVG